MLFRSLCILKKTAPWVRYEYHTQGARTCLGRGGFGFEFLGGVMGDQGVDGGLEHAFHDHAELMARESGVMRS